jgi:hypothetical protein
MLEGAGSYEGLLGPWPAPEFIRGVLRFAHADGLNPNLAAKYQSYFTSHMTPLELTFLQARKKYQGQE